MHNTPRTDTTRPSFPPTFLWFEITGRCNFQCIHCYADSSPTNDHGTLSSSEWFRLLAEARDIGVEHVQFIGGEPTLHPQFTQFVQRASALGFGIEVYTNLFSLSDSTLRLYEAHNVSVATSFYDIDPAITDRITRRESAQRHVIANIKRVIAREIPIRVGIIAMGTDQNVPATLAFLRNLGVTNATEDKVRGVGRGSLIEIESVARDKRASLCGKCANANAAITPNGDVFPCVFARWLPVGNVKARSLREVLSGSEMLRVTTELRTFFSRQTMGTCNPLCSPFCLPVTQCNPQCSPSCSPSCSPNCNPTCSPQCRPGGCRPMSP